MELFDAGYAALELVAAGFKAMEVRAYARQRALGGAGAAARPG